MTSVYEGNKNKPVKTHTCIQKPIKQKLLNKKQRNIFLTLEINFCNLDHQFSRRLTLKHVYLHLHSYSHAY